MFFSNIIKTFYFQCKQKNKSDYRPTCFPSLNRLIYNKNGIYLNVFSFLAFFFLVLSEHYPRIVYLLPYKHKAQKTNDCNINNCLNCRNNKWKHDSKYLSHFNMGWLVALAVLSFEPHCKGTDFFPYSKTFFNFFLIKSFYPP